MIEEQVDYVFLGIIGVFVSLAMIATLPLTVPCYLLGRFVVGPSSIG